MKRCTVLAALFAAFVCLPLFAQPAETKLITCNQVEAWLAGGVSNQRLQEIAGTYGVGFRFSPADARLLNQAGADSSLVQALQKLSPRAGSAEISACSAKLAYASQLMHSNNFMGGESILRKLISGDPRSAALHFALGYERQMQGDWDEAFDEFSTSKELMPGFPETHNRLAMNFFHSNYGDETIGEARTALSIDPDNAEGYRLLGLGLYLNQQYSAALHALGESLERNSQNAQTYADLGLVELAQKHPDTAAASYRKAIRLDPQLLEAQEGLRAALRQSAEVSERQRMIASHADEGSLTSQ